MSETQKPFSTAVSLVRRTSPFLLLNVLVYGAFFVVVVVWLGAFGGLAVFFADRVDLLAVIFLLVAIAVPGVALGFARRYVLYLVQGAHIAVVTTLLTQGQVPEGQSQVAFGRDVVKRLFRDVSILFALDRMIDGTVRTITRQFVRIVDILPLGGGVSSLARLAATVVNRALSYVDEAVLSLAIARGEPNVWRSARHGLILYAQVYKPVLGAAVKIWLLGRVIFFGVLILVGAPGLLLAMQIDAVWFQVVVIAGTILLALLVEKTLFEPFATMYILVTYHRAIEGVEVNAVWDQRLQSVSKRFRVLVGRAQAGATAVDPIDQVQVPPQALAAGDPSMPPGLPTAGGIGGFAGVRPVSDRGVGGMLGGMLSQAAGRMLDQPQTPGQHPAAPQAGDPPAPPPPTAATPPPAVPAPPPPPPSPEPPSSS